METRISYTDRVSLIGNHLQRNILLDRNNPKMKNIAFLVVDSHKRSTQNVIKALDYLNHRNVSTSKRGSEALSILNTKTIGCIIADWDLPDMIGLALLKIVRASEQFSHLPFFLITDQLTRAQVIEAGEAGITGIIVKPMTMESFKQKIDSIHELHQEFVDLKSQQHLEHGKLYLDKEDYDKALTEFKKVLEYNDSPEVYYNIGYIKTAQGKHEEAIVAFRKATQINNMFVKAYRGMGTAYQKLGRMTEAEESLQQAADMYMNKHMDENAEEVLNEILQINPNTVNVFNSLGVLYRKQGKLREALEQYQKALKVTPNEEKIHYNIGRLCIDMKELEKAKEAFTKAIELNPRFEEAKQTLQALEIGIL